MEVPKILAPRDLVNKSYGCAGIDFRMGLPLSPEKSTGKSWSMPPVLKPMNANSVSDEEGDDRCRTPTAREFRIPEHLPCPPPPPPPKRPMIYFPPYWCRKLEAAESKMNYFRHPELESIFIRN
ncbi:hypothetical protein M569_10243 [Genlisea aurea]|uniref:Uncharacterized protein n=1 Tax=Genlisea aurea TaxID=192259 RepID=S8CCB7_9LAMI|nr:hypothetical protein M569_10243 [Genlisea aurea]